MSVAKTMNESAWDRLAYMASTALSDLTTAELEKMKELLEQELERRANGD